MVEEQIQSGRPRVSVDFATLLRMRETDKLGWSRMAQAYMELTGRYISRDTIKRYHGTGTSLLNYLGYHPPAPEYIMPVTIT